MQKQTHTRIYAVTALAGIALSLVGCASALYAYKTHSLTMLHTDVAATACIWAAAAWCSIQAARPDSTE